jgi:LacI family purine nucleotide synthesis repressor
MATIKDVARLANVSVSTVSIIINNKSEERKISIETQNKVNEVIKKLNYQPSVTAKKLRSNDADSYTVGIFWASDFRTAYLSRLMIGLQTQLMKIKMPIDIVICPYEAGKLHLEKKLYSTNSYNAILLANTSEKDNKYIHKHPISVPTVLYNRESNIYHTVGIDNEATGRKAAKHLIERGIKTAGMICHRNLYIGMTKRSKGFYDECIENNIIINEKHILHIDTSIVDGAAAGDKLIEVGLPDGIFCDSDSIAQGLLYKFNRKNIAVPNDIQVISIGMVSSEYNAFYTPSITVVDMPMEKVASKCLQIIEEVASHKIVEPYHFIYEASLIQRESTKKL